MKKKKCQDIHFRKRLLEQYKIKYSQELRDSCLNQIWFSKSKFVCKQSNRISIHDVVFNGVTLRVVYDRERKNLVTALPSNVEVYMIGDE